MLPLTKSVSSLIQTMLPPTLFTEPVEEKTRLNIAMRIEIINQVLSKFLEFSEFDASILNEVNTDDLAKTFIEHKKLIDETKPLFSKGSQSFAQLERMNDIIIQLERKLPIKLSEFNYDLERMKDRVNDTFFELPKFDNVEELDKWLMAK